MNVRSSRWRRLAAGLFALAGAGFVLPATGAFAAQPGPALTSQTPLPVRDGSAQDLGAYSSAQTIRLAIGLRPRALAAEQKFLGELQMTSSPLFHRYLTTKAWTARFGPTAAAQQAVLSWAKGAGLTVTHLYQNRLVVDLAGRVGAIEQALGVQINNYRLGAVRFFANDHDPALPPALRPIVESVEGLSDLQTMYPASAGLREPASPAYVAGPVVAPGPHAAGSGSRARLRAAQRASRKLKPDVANGNYDPTDIYSSQAYDYSALQRLGHCCNPLGNPGNSPPATTIAIATIGSQATSDLVGFHHQYPYLAYNVQEEFIDGTPACCDAEGTMDMEWSTAMSNSFGSAANTAKVYMYDGANTNDSTFTDSYNEMVSANRARVFSTSWSCTEIYGCSTTVMSTRNAIFNEMVGQGWTLVAAAGDRGAYDDCKHRAVSFPASDPDVVGAGGTELRLTSAAKYGSEVSWSGGPDRCAADDGGSGGGCSAVYAAPSFQQNQPCGAGSRGVPDLSLNADWYHAPQNIYYQGRLSGNGGTSIVAPELAGFFAQENAYLLAEGNICGSGTVACAPLGNASIPLYQAALHPGPHDPFYDITAGCNTNNVGTGYCAGPGYDLVTGWGSANMLQLAWAFNWNLFADDGRPVVTFSGPGASTWYNTDQSVGISVTDTGGAFAASGVAGFSAAWDADPGDPSTEATPGTGNSFYSGPEFVSAGGTLSLAAEGQGCHTVNVEAWDNMGLSSGDVTDGPLCYDSVPPAITASPIVRIKNHVGLVGSAKVPVAVIWHGTDATSGVNHYTLYQSEDGGAFSDVATTTKASKVLFLAPGHRYRYEVTGTDKAGNTSAKAAGRTYTLTAYQESSSAITYSAGWTPRQLSGADGGQVDEATRADKTATLTFTGFQVAWVSTRSSARGSATVSLNGGRPATISTNGSPDTTAFIVDTVLGSTGTARKKLVVTVLGTAKHPRIDVDAFIVLAR